ncbi:FMN phosphatase YigB (HAD superfamily) [Pedobacter sp. UYP30]|uniref:hypothetical protein n=1 Tax=Pedobacter sp. UYP30 TaxID=1756400 RepID=UPI00339818C9
MMDITSLLTDKKAIIVELDDVLFPKKDYDLQIYYLFAQFLEMAGEHSAGEIVEFIKEQDNWDDENSIFDRLAQKFDFVKKYKANFDRLYKTARLPLKLFLYQKMCDFLSLAVERGIPIFLVTDGDPETQLNKIKQINWLGLEKNVRIFFADGLEQPIYKVLANLLEDNNLLASEALSVSKNKLVYSRSNSLNLTYVSITEIITEYDQ